MDYARSPLFDTWVAGNLLQSASSTRRPAPHLLAVCLQLAPPQGPPARTHLAFLLEQTEVYRQGVLLDVPCQPTVLESPHLNIPVKWPNNSYSDVNCTAQSAPAQLSFQAHSAPLDCKFDFTYKTMYVTFHGSYDRTRSTGYKLVSIPFTKDSPGNYAPVAPANSGNGYTDIWWNSNVTNCGSTQCFRPVSIVMDSTDRMYVTSDAAVEGELWLLGRFEKRSDNKKHR